MGIFKNKQPETPRPPPITPPKFKVGDRVVRETFDYYSGPLKLVGTITEVEQYLDFWVYRAKPDGYELLSFPCEDANTYLLETKPTPPTVERA